VFWRWGCSGRQGADRRKGLDDPNEKGWGYIGGRTRPVRKSQTGTVDLPDLGGEEGGKGGGGGRMVGG